MADKRQEQFDALMGRISSHLPAEKVEQLRGIFSETPEAALQLGEEVLAKSDYTRSIQQVQAQRQELETERANLAALANKVNEYESYLANNSVTRAEYDQLMAEKATYQQQLDHLKRENPELEFSLAGTTTQGGQQQMITNNGGTQNPPQKPENPIKSVSELHFNQQMNQAVALAALSPAAQLDLAAKHQQLFPNQPLSNMTALVQESMATGKSLEEVWSEQYKVPERIEALNKERFEQEVSQRVEAEIVKRVGAGIVSGNIGGNTDAYNSPFLQQLQVPIEQRRGPAGAPDPIRIANQGTGQGSAAQAATAAFLSGKYKGERVEL